MSEASAAAATSNKRPLSPSPADGSDAKRANLTAEDEDVKAEVKAEGGDVTMKEEGASSVAA